MGAGWTQGDPFLLSLLLLVLSPSFYSSLILPRPHGGRGFFKACYWWRSRAVASRRRMNTGVSGPSPGRTSNTAESGNKETRTAHALEYSPNFHRHIVWEWSSNNNSKSVVESFLWLDDALDAYPGAELLPVESYRTHRYQQCIFDHVSNTACCHFEDDQNAVFVAGGGLNESTAYPVISRDVSNGTDEAEANLAQIYQIFENNLKWFSSQVDKLIEMWPPLRSYPARLLEERLRFLLAPLPDESILQQANVTDDIDWPKLFYSKDDGRGAGMSVAQVSHVLQILPEPMLLRLNYHAYTLQSNVGTPTAVAASETHCNPHYAQMLAYLFEQIPSLTLQMTYSVLDLWVTGTSNLDSVLLAYLHYQGWEWQSCRLFLHALPSCQQCSLEPSWETGRSSAGTRKQLIPEALAYLQLRLQIRPWHIHAMIRTHSRLTGYSAGQLKRNLDFLQESLKLRSSDLRSLLLQMPSLLGASLESLGQRCAFWQRDVGLKTDELRKAVWKKPALLQYSIEKNLEPKRCFFEKDLSLDANSIVRMTLVNPELWGRSFDRYLQPVTTMFCETCDMTLEECGSIISRAPELLRYSILNLQSKLEFLMERLDFNRNELKAVVVSAPRILTHSMGTSLMPKIALLESVMSSENYKTAISDNPSLLAVSLVTLRQRLTSSTGISSSSSAKRAEPEQHSAQRRRRAGNSVILLAVGDSEAETFFKSVSEAAIHAGTSKSYMYKILRGGRKYKGRKYIYEEDAALGDLRSTTRQSASVSTSPDMFQQDLRTKYVIDSDTYSTHLIIHTAGHAFPPEDTVRGRRRTGGMALQIRSWSAVDWRGTCGNLWKGQLVRLLSDGQTLILGYPYLRPSRPRVCMYACREALRVATEWLPHVTTPNATITISTPSNFVLDLLQNTTQVYNWGKAKTRNDFVFTGPVEAYRANEDILYPLARTLYHLIKQDKISANKKNVTIRFVPCVDSGDSTVYLIDGAKLAARLTYKSVHVH